MVLQTPNLPANGMRSDAEEAAVPWLGMKANGDRKRKGKEKDKEKELDKT